MRFGSLCSSQTIGRLRQTLDVGRRDHPRSAARYHAYGLSVVIEMRRGLQLGVREANALVAVPSRSRLQTLRFLRGA